MTTQERLHSILLDAKARIKDGKLYDDDGDECIGICSFVSAHEKCHVYSIFIETTRILHQLIRRYDGSHNFMKIYGKGYDFTDPQRLALLDWLITVTETNKTITDENTDRSPD
jgi:hypothetical protein